MPPKVAVGLMGSSVAKGSASLATGETVQAFLDVCKAHGVQELDTALVYNGGKSEQLLGEVKAGKQFAVSTKAPGFAPGSLTYDNIIRNCNTSLKHLKQEKLDIYLIHGPDRTVPLEDQCRAIGELYKEGKFSRFGVSNISDAEVQSIYDICKKEGYCLPTVYQGMRVCSLNITSQLWLTGLFYLSRRLFTLAPTFRKDALPITQEARHVILCIQSSGGRPASKGRQ